MSFVYCLLLVVVVEVVLVLVVVVVVVVALSSDNEFGVYKVMTRNETDYRLVIVVIRSVKPITVLKSPGHHANGWNSVVFDPFFVIASNRITCPLQYSTQYSTT